MQHRFAPQWRLRTALCENLTIEVVETNWLDCWTSTGTLGPKLVDGTLDACMTHLGNIEPEAFEKERNALVILIAVR